VEDLVRRAIASVAQHPAVRDVKLGGSRSRGTHEELSDWDFEVKTSDFAVLRPAMPALVAPLRPLGTQWEPLGHFPVYQVLLRGPTKVEYLFLEQTQGPRPPLAPAEDTLPAINTHFWDWIWWLATKRSGGHDALVAQHLPQLHRHLLAPLGVKEPPETLEAAIGLFVRRRDELEARFGISLPRDLEHEVLAGMRRI
jgi:hypothetical protein